MTTTRRSGAAWLRQCRITNLSPLGERVADLLGDLFVGLYHLDGAESIDWSSDHHIEVRVAWKEWATFDSNLLTKLVFLAHDRCVRVSVNPRGHHSLTLLFHPREREGGIWARHPTLEQAVAEYRQWYTVEGPVESEAAA